MDFQHGTISYVPVTGATVRRKENTAGSPTTSTCGVASTSGPSAGAPPGGSGDPPGVTSPLASLLAIVFAIIGLPGRLFAPQ